MSRQSLQNPSAAEFAYWHATAVLAVSVAMIAGCANTTCECRVQVDRADADASDDGRDERSDDAGDSEPDLTVDEPTDVALDFVGEVEADTFVCDDAGTPTEAPCTISDAFGVFVASTVGHEAGTGDGTKASPLGSITAGLVLAKAQGKRVYLCDDGRGFNEALTIDRNLDGVQFFGGFECAAWSYATTRRARVTAPESPVLTISGLS